MRCVDRQILACAAIWVLTAAPARLWGDETPPVTLKTDRDRVTILLGPDLVASYVYRDEKILRPHFANVFAPGAVRVTRVQPPVKGENLSSDHGEMHPGVWLAFGDLGGSDFWRNRGRVEHVEFVEPPRAKGTTAAFTVRNRYRDGERTVCLETCTHRVIAQPGGYYLTCDSTFENGESAFSFGDQEEMGLGIRMSDALRVKGGSGRILGAEGQANEEQVRGSTAKWCDYSGTIDGRRAGIILMQHPDNFRPSWYHARDYGLLVANPFGQKALSGGDASEVTVEPGQNLRLRYGLYVYSTPADAPPDYEAAFEDYLKLAAETPAK